MMLEILALIYLWIEVIGIGIALILFIGAVGLLLASRGTK